MNLSQLQTPIPTKLDISKTSLRLILVFFSVLLCAWIMYIQRGRINIDAVLYLESAKLLAHGSWHQAVEIYNWPFYSACIAVVHLLSGLDYESSAQTLNILFFGLTTASFLTIISQSGGGRLELLFGALILFSARHIVGVMLSMPMRDQGFWALLLTAIVFFIRFVKYHKLSDAVLWQLLIVLATLFRIEGVGYLLLLPFAICCITTIENKWRLWLGCYIIPIAILLGLLFISIFAGGLSAQAVGRLQELMPSTILQSLTQLLTTRADLMSEQILGKYLGQYAVESLLISFLFMVILNVINAVGLVNLGLVIKSVWHRNDYIYQNEFKILVTICLISILNLMFIVTSTFILVGRYAAPIGLIFLILASFSLRPWIDRYQRQKIITSAVIVFLLLFIAQNIVKNITPEIHRLFYMKEAALWLNLENKAHNPVLYDNILARYYANEPFLPEVRNREVYIKQQLSNRTVHRYQYIVLNFEGDKEQLFKEQLMKPLLPYFHEIKRFNNQKNNKYMVIYEKNTSDSQEDTSDNVK